MTVKFNNRWDTYTWGFQGPSFFQLFFYTMTQLYMVMELRFLPIVTPTEEEKGYLKAGQKKTCNYYFFRMLTLFQNS